VVLMRTDVRRGAAATGMDQFPVGMRVLAVDDDPVCLKVLETLLRRCQYHGQRTTTKRFLLVVVTAHK
uniref:Response regulatory domain-containing protein n=1 Tax=Aegilops tauschii subsp. strangulata TaxID=200361 RepID=A0A453PWQ5_AEGTS